MRNISKYITGSLFYTYDNQNRLTLETTTDPSTGQPSFIGGTTQYNDNWNYPTAADPAFNLTMVRGTSQSFNANDQLTAETYDGEGNRTSYDGGSIVYDAENRPVSVPGTSPGTTPFTQAYDADDLRAWKLPSGGSKTYFLYDSAGHALCELNSTGAPTNTYAYGAAGLLERYQATSGVPYVVYLFDPGGNLVHRVERDDVKVSGGSRLCSDTAIYDGQGLLHADIDVTSGGFEGTPGAGSVFDCVGYQGQSGAYTDLETVHTASGLYTALTAPGGLTTYYDPLKGLGFSRRQEAVLNAYAQNINPFAGWTFGAYVSEVKQFGVGEIKGAVNYVADRATLGLVHDPIAAHGQNEQAGAETLPVIADTVQWVDGVGEVVALTRFVRGGAAKIVAGASSYFARKGGPGCFVAGTPVQMADGSTKPIEQVKVGDYVKSRNPKTGQTEAKRVLQTTVRQTDQVLTLALTDPKTGHQEWITTTGEHPFYVEGQGFVKAGDLGIGTSIVTRAGPTLTLSHLTWQTTAQSSGLLLDGRAHEGGYTVYNLIVDGDHTYFVGTTGGGAWVHNADCPIPTGLYKDINGHHIHAKAAFNGPGSTYNEDLALTVSDAEIDTWGGASHMGVGSMTSKQNQLLTQLRRDIIAGTRQNSMKEHNKIAVEVLMHGGLSEENARMVVALSLKNLRSQGVRAPNRIFGSRR